MAKHCILDNPMKFDLNRSFKRQSIKDYVANIPINGMLKLDDKYDHFFHVILSAVQSLKAGRILHLLNVFSLAQTIEIAQQVNPGVVLYLTFGYPIANKIILNKYLNQNCVICTPSNIFTSKRKIFIQSAPARLFKLPRDEGNRYFKYSGDPINPIQYVSQDDPLLTTFQEILRLEIPDATTPSLFGNAPQIYSSNEECSIYAEEGAEQSNQNGNAMAITQSASIDEFPTEPFETLGPSTLRNVFYTPTDSTIVPLPKTVVINPATIHPTEENTLSEQLFKQFSTAKAGDTFHVEVTPQAVDELIKLLPYLNKYLIFSIVNGDIKEIKRLVSALPEDQILSFNALHPSYSKFFEAVARCLNSGTYLILGRQHDLLLATGQQLLRALPSRVKIIHARPPFPPRSELGQKLIAQNNFFQLSQEAREIQTEKNFLDKNSPIQSIHALSAKYPIYILDNLSIAQVEAIPSSIKKVFVTFSARPEFLKVLSARNIYFTYPKRIGISQKYLNFRLLPLLPNVENANELNLGTKANADVPTSFVACIEFSALLNQAVQPTAGFSHHHQIAYADIQLDYYAHQPIEDSRQTHTFIFAGRQEKALIPMANNTPRILVLTKEEFEKFPNCAQAPLNFLVISRIHKPYKIDADPIHTITSRRYACLYFSYEMDLEKIIMLDDNIEKIYSKEEILDDDLTHNPSMDYVIEQLENELLRTNALFLSIPSRSYTEKKTHGKYGSKCHLWDLKNIRTHLHSKEMFLALMPESATAWGQVIFAQVLLDSLIPYQQVTRIISPNILQLHRSQLNKNTTKNLGVYATCLDCTTEYKTYLTNISPEFFNTLEAGHFAFNQMVNETIQCERKRLEKLQSMDLESVHAQRNGLSLSPMPPAPTDLCFHENLVRNLQALLSHRSQLGQQSSSLQPHAHQWQSIEFLIERMSIDPNFSNALFEIATGCGKTFIEAAMTFAALASTDKSIVVVCPYRHLTEQTYNAFIEYLEKFPFFTNELNVSSSKIIKVYSGCDKAFSQELVTQNNCQHPRYIFMTCEESFYQLMQNEKFKTNIDLIIFDESHLTVHEKHLAMPTSSNSQYKLPTTLHFTATAKSMAHHTFRFSREAGIAQRLLSPLLVDKLPANIGAELLTPNHILQLLEQHKEPNGNLLMDSKGIIFVKSQKQACQIKECIKQKYPDYPCFQISSDNSERLEHIQKFKAAPYGIGIAVNMLVEGFDHGRLRWILLLRQTDATRLSQIIGRILRLDPKTPDKIGLLIAPFDVQQDSIFPSYQQPPSNYLPVAAHRNISQISRTATPVSLLGKRGFFAIAGSVATIEPVEKVSSPTSNICEAEEGEETESMPNNLSLY